MTKKPTFLACNYHTAGIIFILLGCVFLFVGCTQIYRILGLTDEQAAQQTAQDQETRQELIQEFRLTTTELVSSAIAGAGAILSGLLAKWLGTERKITTALITGIEAADVGNVKESISAKATAAGVETKLHARVLALT